MMANLRDYRRDVRCPNAAPTGCPKPVLPKAVRSIAAVKPKLPYLGCPLPSPQRHRPGTGFGNECMAR